MSELERKIGERLTALADRAYPPSDLGARIQTAVRRRRTRRQRAAITGTSLAVAALIGIPALVVTDQHAPPPATSTASPTAIPTPTDAAALQDLHRLVDMSTAVTIPRELPGGQVFVAESLTRNGTVYGGTVDETADTYGRLWRVGPTGGAPVMVGDDVNVATLGAGDGIVVWNEHSGRATDQHGRQVFCRQVGEDRRRQIGVHGASPVPINVDQDVIVWTDDNDPMVRDPGDPPPGTVWAASGCRDPRPLPVRGPVLAFSHPDVFLGERGEFTETVRQIDVESGQAVATYAVPAGMDLADGRLPAQHFAANDNVLAWTDVDSLFITDRGTARSRRVATGLPHARGVSGREATTLTAGNRLVAYWTYADEEPYNAESVVYDPRTGRTIRPPGDALAAGDWLLWSEGRDYRLARVR